MARKKTQSITESLQVLFTVLRTDKKPLAFIERELMKQREKTDCTDIPDAEIIRHCVHKAYKAMGGK